MSNADLNQFINNDSKSAHSKPWENLDPTARRVGVSAYNISLNDYEKTIIDEAAKKEGGSASTAFMRQAALKRAKIILGID